MCCCCCSATRVDMILTMHTSTIVWSRSGTTVGSPPRDSIGKLACLERVSVHVYPSSHWTDPILVTRVLLQTAYSPWRAKSRAKPNKGRSVQHKGSYLSPLLSWTTLLSVCTGSIVCSVCITLKITLLASCYVLFFIACLAQVCVFLRIPHCSKYRA